MKCNRCPRACNAERTNTQNSGGYCQMPLLPRVARASLHAWEEPCISGKNGSGTIFFSGCSLSCVYCQNSEISHNNVGYDLSVEELVHLFKKLENEGAHNINLVNPTHFSDAIFEALTLYKPMVPVVWNSSGYECVETLRRFEGLVDIYLMDLKYLCEERAVRYSNAKNYPSVATKALQECYRQKPTLKYDENQLLQSGVIVRHLILPQGTKEAIRCFDWVRENLPNAVFSMMGQYVPHHKASDFPEINRQITKREYEKVLAHICDSDFKNVYYQDLSSAAKNYIPDFSMDKNKNLRGD